MTNTDQTPINVAETVRDLTIDFAKNQDITPAKSNEVFTQSTAITVAKGHALNDLTDKSRAAAEYLKPARRKGTAQLRNLDSLIDWTNHFKGETSVLFANPDAVNPSLTSIMDYHAQGAINPTTPEGDPTARHCHHRGVYKFPISREWKAWQAISGKGLEKEDMGEFIEANAKDVSDPTPAILKMREEDANEEWENRLIRTAQQIEGRFGQLGQLLKLSRHFQVFETSNLEASSNRDTGEQSITFASEHKDANGEKLSLPNLIIITIPVFEGGAPYRLTVRFRYRKHGSALKFVFSIYNPERALEDAIQEAAEKAKKETELPLFFGTPES